MHSLRKGDRRRRMSFGKVGTIRKGGSKLRKSMFHTQLGVEFTRQQTQSTTPEREAPWVRAKKARLLQLVAVGSQSSLPVEEEGLQEAVGEPMLVAH